MSSPYLEVVRSPRIAVVLLLGFSSGLPLALTGSTLQAWLAVSAVDIATIAWFSWAGLPYLLKFLWSPDHGPVRAAAAGSPARLDGTHPVLLVAGIAAMAFAPPGGSLWVLGLLALVVACASASQDIVIDAYRADVLHASERGMGAAVGVFGYRIAMLVSGGLALILADRIGWTNAYLIMAALVGIGLATSLLAPEPPSPELRPKSLADAVVQPLREMFRRPGAMSLLLLVMLYKFGDALAGTLTTAFLIRGMGYTPTDVGVVNKFLGLGALLLGALAGGMLLARVSLYRALLFFGVLQAVSNLSFAWLAWAGQNYPLFVFAVGFENLASGMGTAAFVAFAMALCSASFSATQYALLSALASLGRVLFGPVTGAIVAWVGWAEFFVITFLAALPGLWLVWRMREEIDLVGSPRPASP